MKKINKVLIVMMLLVTVVMLTGCNKKGKLIEEYNESLKITEAKKAVIVRKFSINDSEIGTVTSTLTYNKEKNEVTKVEKQVTIPLLGSDKDKKVVEKTTTISGKIANNQFKKIEEGDFKSFEISKEEFVATTKKEASEKLLNIKDIEAEISVKLTEDKKIKSITIKYQNGMIYTEITATYEF